MKLKMKSHVLLLMIVAASFLSGCVTTSDGFKPIRPTKEDMVCISQSLNDQILIHNKHGKALYGWKAR